MRIVLINPPSPCLLDDTVYTPIGLMCVAQSILNHSSDDVSILDLSGGVEWEPLVGAIEADLVGITCVTPNLNMVTRIISVIPDGIPVVLGGPHPTFLPVDTLEYTGCDVVVVGEGEGLINTILDDLRCGIPLKPVYYGGVTPVEELVSPAYDLIDLDKYCPTWTEHGTTIQSSRGCPYSCRFCSKVSGKVYREIPIHMVMGEIGYLMGEGINHFLFSDDNFGINKARAMEILSELGRYDLRFRLMMDTRHVDREVLELAKYVGCIELAYGIETGSARMLEAMNKQATVQNNIDAVMTAKDCGIPVKAILMVNFPGEDYTSVDETIAFVGAHRPDLVTMAAFVPVPGCEVRTNPGDYGIDWMSEDWDDYFIFRRDMVANPCFTTTELTVDMQQRLHDRLYNALVDMGYYGGRS